MKKPKNTCTDTNRIDLQYLRSIIEKEFQDKIKNRNIKNERHLREELTDFLKLLLPANVKVEKEVKTEAGIVDILIDETYILELKYADNKGTLDRGIAEIVRYKSLKKTTILIILDVEILNSKIITKYCSYYENNGTKVIIIKAIGHREKINKVSSFLANSMRGKKHITMEKILSNYSGNRKSLHTVLSRLEKRGLIERIEKGKYTIIPSGAEKGKYTPHEFIVGSILVDSYCIAYWSALNHYGLTEQIPTTVFIQTPARRKKQKTEIFGVRYRTVRIKKEKFFGIRNEWIEDSQVNITDRQKTIVDCLDKPQYCGGIIEVAKGLKNGEFDMERLINYAEKIGNSGVIRRLGYLCDVLRIDVNLPDINTRSYLYLDPTMPHRGKKNAKWRLIVNLDDKILGALE